MLKYLAYGVGEVILIIIGILLAIEISEWNDERNHQRDQQVLLERLLDAVNRDREIPIATMLATMLATTSKTIETIRAINSDFREGHVSEDREYAQIMYRADPRSIVQAEFAELRSELSDAEVAARLGSYIAYFSSVSQYYESNTKDILHQVSRQINEILEIRFQPGFEQVRGTFDEDVFLRKYESSAEFRGTVFRLYLNSRSSYSGLKAWMPLLQSSNSLLKLS